MEKKFFRDVQLFFVVFVASLVICLGGGIITLIQYVVDKPVAKVRLIRICQSEGGESYWGGYYAGDHFANVEIISVSDEENFRETASRISKDGERANLYFRGHLEEGEVYDCYAKGSSRGGGIVSWWSCFRYNLGKNIGYIFLVLFAGLFLMLFLSDICRNKKIGS